MDHLRITYNPTRPEFYKDNLGLIFLNDVKNINIIIGANNTRKSRFMRQIINQPIKVIYNLNDPLNQIYQQSLTLIGSLDDEKNKATQSKLAYFQLHQKDKESLDYDLIKTYFERRVNNSYDIDFFTISNELMIINESLTNIGTNNQFEDVNTRVNQLCAIVTLVLSVYEKIIQNHGVLPTANHNGTSIPNITYSIPEVKAGEPIYYLSEKIDLLSKVKIYLKNLKVIGFENYTLPVIYIPVLRTARTINGTRGDIYSNTIKEQNFQKSEGKFTIETGLLLYEKIMLARNGNRNQIRNFREFERFIGLTFFRSEDIHIVAHKSENDNENFIRISLPGELDDVSIQELGDGVQAIINLLFPIFTAEDGSWICIDEPENHLHPGYQNVFMRAISENETILKKKLKFFINTHSNHILSEAILGTNTGVFVFSRRDEHSSQILSFDGNEYNTLEMLGVFNTSVLISNCSIWVEGITDRLYLKSFLFAYGNDKESGLFNPVEGLHFSYIEYAGKNLIHYEFDTPTDDAPDQKLTEKIKAYFINTNIFLLADSDFNPEKHKIYDQIQRPNFKYEQTGVPEIENLIPKELLKQYLLEELKCDEEQINSCFEKDHLTMKLGEFLQGKITKGGIDRKFEADSGGTLNSYYKKGLADFVHRKIMAKEITWDKLKKSKELKRIVTSMHSFIVSKNGK